MDFLLSGRSLVVEPVGLGIKIYQIVHWEHFEDNLLIRWKRFSLVNVGDSESRIGKDRSLPVICCLLSSNYWTVVLGFVTDSLRTSHSKIRFIYIFLRLRERLFCK